MDGYFVHGYVNNNKKYYFKITIHPYTNYQYNDAIGYKPSGLGKLFISDDSKKNLSTNDIIKKNIWTKINMKLSRLHSSCSKKDKH